MNQLRGDRGSRSTYERVLRRVPNVPPEEGDALPDKRIRATRRG